MDAVRDAASHAASQASEAERMLEERLTVLWHEIQSWQQDNHYIHSGYRPASSSYRNSFSSLRFLHNETVNIYTHLLGSMVAIVSGVVLYGSLQARYETASRDDVVVFACFFIGAAACLGMSATYHTISNHSPEVARLGNKLDYLGIVCLIWGSFVPSIFYGFQEDVTLTKTYWAMVCSLIPLQGFSEQPLLHAE